MSNPLRKSANGASPAPSPPNENERMNALERYDILDTDPERAFDEITKIASVICETPIAAISLVDDSRQWFKSSKGLVVKQTDRDIAFCSHAILAPDTILEVQDATLDERFNTNPLLDDASLHLRFYAGAPLVTADKKALGTLCVIDRKPRKMTDTQREALRALSHLVVDQMELRLRNKQLMSTQSALEVSEAQLRSHNQKLEERNADLEERLKEVEKNEANILNTPAGGVINLLRQIHTEIGPRHILSNDLEQVINIIGSHKLYEVDVSHAIQHGVPDIDAQTKGFLLTQLSNFTEKKTNNENVHKHRLTQPKKPYGKKRRSSTIELYNDHLTTLHNWDYDTFRLQQVTNGAGLLCASYKVIEHHGLFSKLNMSSEKFANFLHHVEEGYLTNPYHNSTHATDVFLACNYLAVSSGLEKMLTAKEFLALLLSCIVHDLGHPGLNNAFLVNTTDKLALRHNDRSVLENHHCVQAFKLLQQQENDFLDCLTSAERQEVRKLVIELVLATDMANHVEIMNQFNNRRKTAEGLDLGTKEDRLLSMKMMIKCADISNPARPPPIYKKWVDCIMEEFYQQGDKEKELSLPVSAFMDRETTHIPKCQLGFIQYICLPTFTALIEQFPGAGLTLNLLQANMAEWKRQEGTQ